MTYKEITRRVNQAIAMSDPWQHDAHVWTWLDHEACNANHLRDAIRDVTSEGKFERNMAALRAALA